MSFVHLHVHSEYSLLESTLSIKSIIDLAAKEAMPAVALTDRNNLFGAVEFFSEAKKKGIQPIIGCELNVLCEGSMTDRSGRRGQDLAHIILLVQNDVGYKNLCDLVSAAHLKGFYYKPRIDLAYFSGRTDGLIALSGCSHGIIATEFSHGQPDKAEKRLAYFSDLFPDRFYIELQKTGRPSEAKLNRELIALARKTGTPLVATNDCHYKSRDSASAQEVLMCIASGKTLDDFDHDQMPSDDFFFKSEEEMTRLFENEKDALDATVTIANQCHFEFDFKTYHFPKFDVPKDKSLDHVLREEAKKGLIARLLELEIKDQTPYEERLDIELDVISTMGFSGYFLIVADFIQHAKHQGIAVGPGRGSAAGSLVAYALQITDLDPLPYNLLFERFLNPERISMPDVDIDFCMRRRDEVIQYVAQKYGSVSQIITFGKMKAKAVLRDVARVLNIPYSDADTIAKLVPNALNITLKDAIDQEPRLKAMMTSGKDQKVKRLIELALELEGLSRHASIHAAGVVISDKNLSELVPLYRGANDETVTQYDMKAVEKIGLIKFDFLGLKTLTLIEDALAHIERRRASHELPLNFARIPLDDARVYDTLSKGDTLGVFQLESSGMRELIVKLAPTCFEDLIALVALYRPGPLGSGMVDDFIDRKHGRKEIVYDLPELEEILRDTYGVIVYQEQVMQIASRLASYSLGEADILRRAMGKKKPEEMDAQKKRFLDGAAQNKIPADKAVSIFDLMAKFAEYGFNKSHSAAYALVSYQTAYLKTHHRAAYMASLLTSEMGDTDKILLYSRDCQAAGITLLPPDINQSEWSFGVASECEVRYGLGAIKGVGAIAIESVMEARKSGPFKDLYDLTSRIDLSKVNRRVLEALIRSGACDGFQSTRKQLDSELDRALEMGVKVQHDERLGQTSLFDAFLESEKDNKPVQTDTSVVPSLILNEWDERLRLKYEKDVLGFYFSGHPLSEYQTLLTRFAIHPIATLKDHIEKSDVVVCGIVRSLKEIMTKTQKRMAFVDLEDLSGRIEVIVFSDVFLEHEIPLKADVPLVITGTLDKGTETTKLLATTLAPLDTYTEERTRGVHLMIKDPPPSDRDLDALQNILQLYRGSCPTYIHIHSTTGFESRLRLSDAFTTHPSPVLARRIADIFGGRAHVVIDVV